MAQKIDLIKLDDLVAELANSEAGLQGCVDDLTADALPADMEALKQEAELAPVGSDQLVAASLQTDAHAAAEFLRVAKDSGFRGLCDALAFCGLRNELPQLFGAGMTVLAPTDEAFRQLDKRVRCNAQLVRSLLLAHFCSGTSSLAELQEKRCAVGLAGQTHAVVEQEGGHTAVGTGRVSRPDITFEGGVIHQVDSVLVVLQLARDSHAEQVWKKTLQPAPTLSVVAAVGGATAGADYEVHGCLLYAATGQLVPEALRGHVRSISSVGDEQTVTFSEITVMAKPPSLAKRRGVQADGSNRYRLVFSLWDSSTQSYVSWQHMATPLVVRNSFHMLPEDEKNYRRQQYARNRTGRGGGDMFMMDSRPEGSRRRQPVSLEAEAMREPPLLPPPLPSLPEAGSFHGALGEGMSVETRRWVPLSKFSDVHFSNVRRATSFDTEVSDEPSPPLSPPSPASREGSEGEGGEGEGEGGGGEGGGGEGGGGGHGEGLSLGECAGDAERLKVGGVDGLEWCTHELRVHGE